MPLSYSSFHKYRIMMLFMKFSIFARVIEMANKRRVATMSAICYAVLLYGKNSVSAVCFFV